MARQHHTLLATLAALIVAVVSATSVDACLWDKDTLAAEARGMPDVVDIIVGKFERNPPLYYEMRLQRVTANIEVNANRLDLYDDAGVACDRLGDSDAAIDWMRRKHEQMAVVDMSDRRRADHEYRYLANLGTFHAHRWFRNGADREDLADLEKAEQLITAAIELNPEAHFGREKYQLLAIKAILRPIAQTEEYQEHQKYLADSFPTILDTPENAFKITLYRGTPQPAITLQELGYEDAVEGLTGLISLGNAWESVDIYHALSMVLAYREEASLALLAQRRAQELIDDGRYPVVPGLPEGLHRRMVVGPRGSMATKPEEVFVYFDAARAAADQWAADREAYMLARLQAGQHPDTHPDFWAGWDGGAKLPPQPGTLAGGRNWIVSPLGIALLVLLAILSAVAGAVLVIKRGARHRADAISTAA